MDSYELNMKRAMDLAEEISTLVFTDLRNNLGCTCNRIKIKFTSRNYKVSNSLCDRISSRRHAFRTRDNTLKNYFTFYSRGDMIVF